MDFTQRITLLVVYVLLLSALSTCQSSSNTILSISVYPARLVSVGGDFSVTCTVDTHQSKYPVQWKRRVGDVASVIGIDATLDPDYTSFTRYRFVKEDLDGSKQRYTLHIRTSGYEDTAFYECYLINTEIKASTGVAVCEDTSLYSCKCMQEKPLDPICFEESSTVSQVKKKCQNVNIGLGVLLALTFIYAVGMSIYLGRDHLINVKDRNKERINQMIQSSQQAQNRGQGYTLSETTVLDPNDSISNINESTPPHVDSPARYPANHLQGEGKVVPRLGAMPTEEDMRPRPKQVGRQGERQGRQQQPQQQSQKPQGHSNEAYNTADEPLQQQPYSIGGAANTVGHAALGHTDIGYAPYPASSSHSSTSAYPSQPVGGARPKDPSPRGSTSSASTPRSSSTSGPLPRYGDANPGSGQNPKVNYAEPPPNYASVSGSAQVQRYPKNDVPLQDRRAFTDVSKQNGGGRGGAQSRGYTEPRKLEFNNGPTSRPSAGPSTQGSGSSGAYVGGQGEGNRNYSKNGGAYVDDSDTVV